MDAGQLAYMVYASCPETIDFVVPCKWLVLTEADVNGSLFIAEVACRTEYYTLPVALVSRNPYRSGR